jgi:epoxyqueuosine reductase
MQGTAHNLSSLIREAAGEQGFGACGIAKAGMLEREAGYFSDWLGRGYQAGMSYMERNAEKRLDPTLLNDWARSVVMLTYNYHPADTTLSEGNYKISKYAYGRDYHAVIRQKIRQLISSVRARTGKFRSRIFVDSAPVMERAWAVRCGLGWTGKNACLISREKGSFFFLGCIITDLDLAPDEPHDKDYCGNCTRCLDACPNGAIIAPGVVDARRCISYLTIEKQGRFEKGLEGSLHGWIFGCDICQDVCPWNRFSSVHNEPAFEPGKALLEMRPEDWENLDEEKFKALFSGTALERTGYENLMRNIRDNIKE